MRSLNIYTLSILIAHIIAVSIAMHNDSSLLYIFPESIPIFNVRVDTDTHQEVSRGKLNELGITQINHPIEKGRYKYEVFIKHLQCASSLPELNSRGTIKMLEMVPLTRSMLEIICSWAESGCGSWIECQHKTLENKKGQYRKEMTTPGFGGFRDFRLLRVINNKLHHDWPWGMERFKDSMDDLRRKLGDHYMLLQMVLSVVSDMKDCLFFFGHERSILPWNIPFPAFSFAPQLGYGDFPFPFVEMYKNEFDHEARAAGAKNYSDAFYMGTNHLEWNERIPKAAFFASLDTPQPRQLVYDQAVMRPDLFDASFSSRSIHPWNPQSNESNLESSDNNEIKIPERQHPGYAQHIKDLWLGKGYTPGHYKYVIVPAGSGVLSLSGRLAGLLAHSGAVILLQETDFFFHFSVRLKPWVHYVPLAYNMADATDKIEWLKANDELAQRIASNGRNFGKSYLRIEDYYCYAATAMKLLADMQEGTDVVKPFDPVKLQSD